MLWVSLVLGAICLSSKASSVADQWKMFQWEMDKMTMRIEKLESESAERRKITDSGRQNFPFSNTFLFCFVFTEIQTCFKTFFVSI